MSMAIDPWLPRGFSPSAGLVLQRCVHADEDWQIYDTLVSGRVLVVRPGLAEKWVADGFLSSEQAPKFEFGSVKLAQVPGGRGYRLEPVDSAETPNDFSECQAFVAAIAGTRRSNTEVGLHDSLYIERLSRLLPCYSPAPKTDDATVAGYWISGGVRVPLTSARRMRSLAPWLSQDQVSSLASVIATPLAVHDGDKDDAAVAIVPDSPSQRSSESFSGLHHVVLSTE